MISFIFNVLARIFTQDTFGIEVWRYTGNSSVLLMQKFSFMLE